MKRNLVSTCSQTGVTALHFCNDGKLLAGVGSYIKVYDGSHEGATKIHKVLAVNKIHGVIDGIEKNTCIVWGGKSLAVVDTMTLSSEEYKLHDWIVSVIATDGKLYALTAHNEVVVIEYATKKILTICRIQGEKSILYSGALHVDSSSGKVIAASGTVMGGVVVWHVNNGEIIHTFTLHQGSIFDVVFDDSGKYVASCSDDWSIMLWDLEQGILVAKGWGHAARIWSLKFFGERLISCSEDCTVRVWEVNGERLNCVSVKLGHQGRNIWSIALTKDLERLASGGGDGKIVLWDLESSNQSHVMSLTIDNVMGLDLALQASKSSPNFKNSIIHNGLIVTVLTSGHILYATTQALGANKWQYLGVQLDQYALLRKTANGIVAIGRGGTMVMIRGASSTVEYETIDLVSHGNLPLREALILDDGSIVCQGQEHTSSNLVMYNQRGEYRCTMDRPDIDFVLTAATSKGNFVYLGSRLGSLVVFDISITPTLICHLPRVLKAGRDSITCLKIREKHTPELLITDRCGIYGTRSTKDFRVLSLNRYNRSTLEGILEYHEKLICYGFKNEKFMVYNITDHCEIFSEDCGSRKRAWNLDIDTQTGKIWFGYLRLKNLVFVENESGINFPRVLQRGTHGREIRSMAAKKTNDGCILATGGEDTSINLGWLGPAGDSICTKVTLHSHISGIQKMQWHPAHSDYLCSAGGKNELIIWKVTSETSQIDAFEVGRLPVPAGTSELRVMDFSFLDDIVAVGYSDSSIRLWSYKLANDQVSFELLATTKYSDRCLLNVDLVYLQPEMLLLLVSSTDGHLAVWNLIEQDLSSSLSSQPIIRHRIHQSGIRCSTIVKRDGGLKHFSGGEDNAIHGVEIRLAGGTLQVSELFKIEDAHASTITDLAIIDNDRLLSTSADQKIRVWVDTNVNESCVISDVSDTGVIWTDGNTVIAAGSGIETFKFN